MFIHKTRGRSHKKFVSTVLYTLIALAIVCYMGIEMGDETSSPLGKIESVTLPSVESTSELANLEYDGKSIVKIDEEPSFSDKDIKKAQKGTFLKLKSLDPLGRCQVAKACVSKDTLAEGERGSISMIRPSGWPRSVASSKYDFIDGKYAFNRSHLIMHKLYGDETNDERNLITGTRQLNAGDNGKEGMLTYEKKIVNFVENSDMHVLYKVTPIYRNDELIPRGVQMEAMSLEDKGKSFKLNIYVFNVQDRLEINYYTGETSEI